MAIDADAQSVNIVVNSAWRKASDRALWWHSITGHATKEEA